MRENKNLITFGLIYTNAEIGGMKVDILIQFCPLRQQYVYYLTKLTNNHCNPLQMMLV